MSKIASKGTTLKKSISAVFTTITQLETVNAPEGVVQFSDVTDLSSSVGREKIPTGYVETGVCTASGFFDPTATTHKNLTTDITTPPSSAQSWKVVWSDGSNTEWPFSGWVSKFKPMARVGEPLKLDIEIQPTGLVTYPT